VLLLLAPDERFVPVLLRVLVLLRVVARFGALACLVVVRFRDVVFRALTVERF
jgi:hypothetical protein